MSLYKIHCSYSLVLICGRFSKKKTEDHRVLSPLRSEKLLQYSFWRFVDTRPIVWPRFRRHFADILNSQLMYTVQLLMIKAGLTLRLSFPKARFYFADSPFKFPLLPISHVIDPLGTVYTDAVSFAIASVSMRLHLSFTRRRSNSLSEPGRFEYAFKSGAFSKRYGFIGRVNGETASI